MKEKIKTIIYNILTYIKWIILVIVHFILSIFSKKERNEEIPKLKKLINNKDNSVKNKTDAIPKMPADDDARQITNNFLQWELPQDELILKKYIKNVYLKILNLNEDQINAEEKIKLNLLQETLVKQITEEKEFLEIKVEAIFIDKLENEIKQKLQDWDNIKNLDTEINHKTLNEDPINKNTIDEQLKGKIINENKDKQKFIIDIENKDALPKQSYFNIYQTEKKINENNILITTEKLTKTEEIKLDAINFNENTKTNTPENNFISLQENRVTINEEKEILNLGDEIFEENTITNANDIEIQNLSNESNKENAIILNDKNLELNFKSEELENKKEVLEKTGNFDKIDFLIIESDLLENEKMKSELTQIQELEDKDYDTVLTRLDNMLDKIDILYQNKNLNEEDKIKLNEIKDKVLKMKENIESEKEADILEEKKLLIEDIQLEYLDVLEQNIKQIHDNVKQDLANNNLESLEDLDSLNKEKSKMIEQKLLKDQLREANDKLRFSFIKSLFLFRNKYFLYFARERMVNKHLRLFDAILKHTTLEYLTSDFSQIKKGADALEDALNYTTQNKAYLSYLEEQALFKFPELRSDLEFMLLLDDLKRKIRKNEERLIKKKKMAEKYNLNFKSRLIRKLQHKKTA